MKRKNTKCKNWNMFAGETEYKCNFALQFCKPFTLIRYKQDKFERFRFHLKSYFAAMFLSWTYVGFTCFKTCSLVKLIAILASIITGYYFTVVKRDRLWGRYALLAGELLFQTELSSTIGGTALGSYILLFNVPTLVSDLLLVYIWYQHLAISGGLLIVHYILNSQQHSEKLWYEALTILFTTTIFGYIERIMKEDWVLYDSFKRAQNLYLKMVDKFQTPTFVVDCAGRILHQNTSAKQLYEKYRKVKSTGHHCATTRNSLREERGIFETVHPEYRKKLDEVLKKTAKEVVQPVDIPLLMNNPAEYLISECNLGLDVNLINQGDREKRVNTGKNKKKRIQSLEEVKTLQYMNEHTMFSLIQMLGSPKPETTPFYIMDKIEYVMNLFNSKAVEKGVTLILSAEPCFPKEVNGDRFKFELILATMVEYLLKKTQNGEIKLYARMKYPFEGGFLLGFDFEVIPSKSLSVEDIRNLQALSSSKLEYWKDSAYTINQSLHIIKHLGGELEITDQPVIKITVELPFLGKESSQECVAENKIGVYRVERPGEFTKKWTAVIGPSETTPGTRRRSPGLPRSITQKFGADEMVARDKIKLAVSKLQGKTASVLVPNGETSTSKLNKNTTFSNKEELLAKIKEEEATKAMGEVRSEIREDSKKGEVQSEMRSVVKDDSESRSEMKDTQSVAKLKLADELSRRESQTPHEVDTPQLDPDLPVQEKAEKKRTFSFTENVGDSSAKPKPDIRVNPDRPEEE